MKKNIKNKGFTLIELLTVIAIIGILSTVILISLNTARGKGKDAKIRSETSQIKTQLESNYVGGVYADLIADSNHIDTLNVGSLGYDNLTILKDDILAQMGSGAAFGSPQGLIIYSNETSAVSPADYGIYASTTDGYFCLDSFGNTNQSGTGSVPDWATIEAAAGTPPTKLCL